MEEQVAPVSIRPRKVTENPVEGTTARRKSVGLTVHFFGGGQKRLPESESGSAKVPIDSAYFPIRRGS